MSIRFTLVVITLSGAALWVAVLRPTGAMTASARSAVGEPGTDRSAPSAAPLIATTRQPSKQATVPAATPPRARPPTIERTFAPESDVPAEFPEALRVALEEEQRKVNANRAIAAAKLEQHMALEPMDSARTDRVREEYEEVLDDFREPVRAEVRCTEKACQVKIDTGDHEVLAGIQKLHGARGYKAMTSIEGDRNAGSIDSVTYSLIDEDLLHAMVGPDTTGIFSPGRTEQLMVERP